jgi:phosphoglucomutase
VERRVQAAATSKQRIALAQLSSKQVRHHQLAGETIERILDRAPGNDAPIGGLKVIAKSGWFAARPSGTEDVYKIYAESFRGERHLDLIVEEAQAMVDGAIGVKRKR